MRQIAQLCGKKRSQNAYTFHEAKAELKKGVRQTKATFEMFELCRSAVERDRFVFHFIGPGGNQRRLRGWRHGDAI